MFQAQSVRDAAFGCIWVGTPIQFQRCLMFIIATANKEFQLTAGKFVPVSNVTTINVRIYACMNVLSNTVSNKQYELSLKDLKIPKA
jgi:hypothetical protein